MTPPVPFEDLLREQEERGRWIQRFWVNILKLGKDKMTKAVLEQRQNLLEKYWDGFLEGHRQLMRCKESVSSSYAAQDTFTVIENMYLDHAAKIAQGIADASKQSSSSEGQAAPGQLNPPQLPKICLPTFDGDPLQWESFRDLFKSLVHNVPHLPDVQKLLYLKTSLTGEAADVVLNTPITDGGYRGAWEDLELRYGNTRLLSFSHHRALLACPPAKQQSAAELKRLLDTFRQTIRAYTALRKPVASWDEWLVYFLSQKLDRATHLAWETSLPNSREVPPFHQLTSFLENRIQALNAAQETDPVLHPAPVKHAPSKPRSEPPRRQGAAVFAASSRSPAPRRCPSCAGTHSLAYCAKFKALAPPQRKVRAQQLDACRNCLAVGHETSRCPSSQSCLACSKRHHTLLHDAMTSTLQAPPTPATAPSPAEGNAATALTLSTRARSTALLATARVKLEAPSGEVLEARALLDTGSDVSLVSTWVAQTLRLPRRAVRVTIAGVQESESGVARSEVDLCLRSRLETQFCLPVRALVLRKLTSLLPARAVTPQPWPHLEGVTLADPDYGVPSRVDLILGADVCGMLLQDESRVGPAGTPTAKRTPFGWVLMGPASDPRGTDRAVAHSLHCRTEDSADVLLRRFWELEELQERPTPSPEEQLCEQHFRDTHTRDASTGRYCVRLLFKQDPVRALKPNRSAALRLLLACERRLAYNAALGDKYPEFMKEYLSSNHMEAIADHDRRDDAYYLPHHAVVKRHDPSAKLRVVFNASFQTSSGCSLNDCLLTGPRLQSDLWMVLTRWRLFKIAFTSDIVKMFRQIRVHPADVDWQRILWRAQPDDPVQDFHLTTVTYGTACAPFLALRVLSQLAADEQGRFPQGADAIRRLSYVDDILAGADDVEQALETRRQLVLILKAGGFELSKWASNSIPLQDAEAAESRSFQDFDGVSTLGIIWTPATDSFSLRVLPPSNELARYTKRQILSEVASLFDPLGWVAPVLIYAKIIIQDLWILGVDWDESLPQDLLTRWSTFRRSLPQLDALAVPRWTRFITTMRQLELHGFCDASQRAYAAAVYLRINEGDKFFVNLLLAKTKVAPVKTLSIPRLELCAAVLLSRLIAQLKGGLDLPATVTAWTDSSVTLQWIQGHASRWKPFVAHRVATIHDNLPSQHWRHVATSHNPADLVTRGITPMELLNSQLWWTGPPWLHHPSDQWPSSSPKSCETADLERARARIHLVKGEDKNDLLSRFSTLTRLVNVLALCIRFGRLTRKQPCETGFIRTSERAAALKAAIRLSQRSEFPVDIDQLRCKRELRRSSPLVALRPFLDDQQLLRLGGRLEQAILPYDEKHPYIIGKDCPMTTLLVRDAHLRTLHGGPQLTRSLLLRRYWIVHGRSLVRSVLRRCFRCVRYSGVRATQLMGSLPPERITPQRPFLTTGVDYAGPVKLRTTAGRGHKSYKGYISLFVCLATRAIHLEAVSDLTSIAFLAAFQRFVSRRGRCATMLSDNGTVFHGADRELRELFQSASNFYREAATSLAADGTHWRFIPPLAPHFGGLWEAGVRSVKHHLKRVIGDTPLTFEEMSTLLCRVEACVNSRPLHALSDDPSDLTALTPGHFLIGEAPCTVPEPEQEPSNTSLRTRWRHLSLMRTHFWHRWQREYLHQMQQTSKWRQQRDNLVVGSLVLLRDDLQPPTKWAMGRIETVHPGLDGRVRVVTVKTAGGTLKRPIAKICPLPAPSADATSGECA